MNMSVHQSSSSGVAKVASSVVHTWVRLRHNLHVGSHDYCHAPLGVSSFSFSAYKMYGNGHRVAGPEAAIFDEDQVWGRAPPGQFLKLGALRLLLWPCLSQNATKITS